MINCIWCVIITLTSVGYGDIYPKTYFGRTVGILICFWGFFIISFFVLTVENILSFNQSEKKAFDILQSLTYKHEMKKKAVKVLSSAYALKNLKQNRLVNSIDRINKKQAMISKFQTFRSSMLEF